jgi:hypothetical protein
VSSIRDPHLLPGGSKYDDLPGMLAVAAPQPLWLAGEDGTSAKLVCDAYEAAGEKGHLTFATDYDDAIAWLMK